MGEEPRDALRLSPDWLSVQEVVEAVSSPTCGAVAVFVGVTREDVGALGRVAGLKYEAYEPMVAAEFSRLCSTVRRRWPNVRHIAMHHRLGWVKVGEASVVMAISSPHRQDGQQALQHAMDLLKASLPIWKKEVYDTQESSWKENAECQWSRKNQDQDQDQNQDQNQDQDQDPRGGEGGGGAARPEGGEEPEGGEGGSRRGGGGRGGGQT